MKSFGFWLPIAASIILTPFALPAAVASAGAGHENYFRAKIIFPYTMLSTVPFHSIRVPFIILAIFQFPLYGIILAFADLRKRTILSATILIAIHGLAAALCFLLVSGNFS